MQMVLGICLSFPKMGSSLNAFVTPRLSTYFEEEGEHMNVAGPIFVGAVLMSLSLGLAISIFVFIQYWPISTAKARARSR